MPDYKPNLFDLLHRKPRERRTGADIISRAITFFACLAWFTIAVTIFVFSQARVQTGKDMFVRLSNTKIEPASWDAGLLRITLMLLIFNILICCVGFFLNMLRHHRKEDKFNKSIIIIGGLSVILTGLFIWQFGSLI